MKPSNFYIHIETVAQLKKVIKILKKYDYQHVGSKDALVRWASNFSKLNAYICFESFSGDNYTLLSHDVFKKNETHEEVDYRQLNRYLKSKLS